MMKIMICTENLKTSKLIVRVSIAYVGAAIEVYTSFASSPLWWRQTLVGR